MLLDDLANFLQGGCFHPAFDIGDINHMFKLFGAFLWHGSLTTGRSHRIAALIGQHGRGLTGAARCGLTGDAIAGEDRTRICVEFRADPDSPYHDKNLSKDKTIIVYCASGGRSALSGKTLKDMGYANVYNLGAFKDWAEAGGAIDKPMDPGM